MRYVALDLPPTKIKEVLNLQLALSKFTPLDSSDVLLDRIRSLAAVEKPSLSQWEVCLALRKEYTLSGEQDLPTSDLAALLKMGCDIASSRLAGKLPEDRYEQHHAQVTELARMLLPRTAPSALQLPKAMMMTQCKETKLAAQAYLKYLMHNQRSQEAGTRWNAVKMRYLRYSLLLSAIYPPELLEGQSMHRLAVGVMRCLNRNLNRRNFQRVVHILRLLDFADLSPPSVALLQTVAANLPQASSRFPRALGRGQYDEHPLVQFALAVLLFDAWPKPNDRFPTPAGRQHIRNKPTPVDLAVSLWCRYMDVVNLPSPRLQRRFLAKLESQTSFMSRRSLNELVQRFEPGPINEWTTAHQQHISHTLLRLAVRMKWYDLTKALYLRLRAQHRLVARKLPSHQAQKEYFDFNQKISNGKDQPFTPITWLLESSLEEQHKIRNPGWPLQLWFMPKVQRPLPSKLVEKMATFVGSLASWTWSEAFLKSIERKPTLKESVNLLTAHLRTGRIMPTLRVLNEITSTTSEILPLDTVYNPLLELLSTTHPRRTRLMYSVLTNMPHHPDADSYLFLMRSHSHRWDLSLQDLRAIEALKIRLVEDGLAIDGRHQGEFIYALTRRQELAEALGYYMRVAQPRWVSTHIVGLLVCRLADMGWYDEARRVLAKWRSGHGDEGPKWVTMDEKTLNVAELYLASKQGKQPRLDAGVMKALGLRRRPAVKRLERKLAAAASAMN